MIGLKAYSSHGKFLGFVTGRHTSDEDVIVIDNPHSDLGEYEVPIKQVAHILTTLLPDRRGEHVRIS